MFDGVPAEQLHQLIASSRTSLPLPLPLPLSSFPSPPPNNNINTFHVPGGAPFDPYNNNNNPSHLHHHQLLQIQPHQLHQNHQLLQLYRQSTATPENLEEKEEHSSTVSISINNNLEIERDRSSSVPASSSDVPISSDPWSNDELLALLRIRSTMENWFPEFTWEHVSRKLAELGFKRSAEKCKEKFEEESRYFNNIYFTKNYRFLSDLEQICQGGGDAHQRSPDDHDHRNPDDHQEAPGDKNNKKEMAENPNDEGDHPDSTRNETLVEDNIGEINEPLNLEEHNEKEVVVETRPTNNNNKRKRKRRFEMLKGFCEDIVNRMMAQQEEIHNKLVEEMVKRNEEKLAREEAWKKQETDRMNKELEIMAREQAVAGDRQATIIKFLKKFTSSSSNNSSTSTSSSPIQVQNPTLPMCRDVSGRKELDHHQEKENNPTTPSSLTESTLAPQSPTSSTLARTPLTVPTVTISLSTTTTTTAALAPPENPSSEDVIISAQNPSSISHDKQDLGKRWPRDEVLALINLRCSLFNNGGSGGDQDKDGGVVMKAPLWERISQGMFEMGYKRSSKRCKEKWENINKYFRKTKNVNKKRSLDSRTCPYFHQLSTLYDQGILVSPSDQATENRPASPENHSLGDGDSTKHDEGEKNNNMVKQAPTPAFDFEF